MNQLQVFNFHNHNVRIINTNNEMWFVLKDVCDVLEIHQTAGIKLCLSDDVITNHPIPDALGRMQKLTVINENKRSMSNIGRQGNVNVAFVTNRKRGSVLVDTLGESQSIKNLEKDEKGLRLPYKTLLKIKI